jgi:Fur family peroxide stress response transcriptional regulator
MMSVEQFIEACREKGLNVTYQRILIYKALKNSASHPTAEDIYKTVKVEYPSISLATVYKTLETLSENGLLSKVTELHDLARYDAEVSPHHHILCRKCKKVMDVHDEQLENIPIPQTNEFTVEGVRILFEGICKECAAKQQEAQKDNDVEPVTFCGKSKIDQHVSE